MKDSKKKLLVVASVVLCVVLLVGAVLGFAGYRYWCRQTYPGQLFAHCYSINFNLYSQNHINATYMSNPEYYLSENGKLYEVTRDSSKYKAVAVTGYMERIVLTEQNFDQYLNEDNWVASGISIESARTNNKETWYGKGKDGTIHYVMLQNNGDVFLCNGFRGGFFEILWLEQAGDRNDFYDYIENMNAIVKKW